jgi:hypothetical protein
MKFLEKHPQTIANLERNCLGLRQQISTLKDSLDAIRKGTLLEVHNAKDGDKKEFPNAEVRELETERRLALNGNYQETQKRLKELEKEKGETEILIQQARDEFSVARYRLRCETAEKVEEAARQFTVGLQVATGLVEVLQRVISSPAHNSEYTDYTEPEDDIEEEDWPF